MTKVNVQERFDQAVTERGLAQAIERGQQRQHKGFGATAVRYLPEIHALLISFSDQSAIALPVGNYPEIAALTTDELTGLAIGFAGSALCLDERELHVSIAGLISASEPLMDMAATVIASRNGSRSSAVKAQASRVNGRKGGRPRKIASG